jgi:uncharacterized membrane protein
VHRVEALWLKIVGVLLILLGVVLFSSPNVNYSTREKIGHTDFKVKREKALVVPRPASAAIIAAGLVTLILASRTPRQ